jgi:hypothetical protein
MSRKDKGREKGKGMATSGIPLSGGGISQIEDTSVETNNFEAANAFKEDRDESDDRPYDKRDFIGDQEEQMNDGSGPFIANKDDEEWSEGMEDEANLPDPLLNESDDEDEALFPETEPLHVDLSSTAGLGGDDSLDMVLRPDTIDNQPDTTADAELKQFGNRKTKKSA